MANTEYEMTADQLKTLMDACKPVPLIMPQCGMTQSPQDRANDVWKYLGAEMGFDPMSVRPIPGKGPACFTARAVLEDTQ